MTERIRESDIREKIINLKYRDRPEIYKKIVKEDDGIGSHLVKSKTKVKYKYYICDYCGKEIKIEKDWGERTGGKVILPGSLTKSGEIVLALHNKCLKLVISKLEEDF